MKYQIKCTIPCFLIMKIPPMRNSYWTHQLLSIVNETDNMNAERENRNLNDKNGNCEKHQQNREKKLEQEKDKKPSKKQKKKSVNILGDSMVKHLNG